ncbi:MAG: endonuclease NucS [Sphaerochaeta sp.]|nr:endonuclease NucS [Sphaerochaeta sp.]
MKRYYRVMLGSKSKYADVCKAGSFIGADFTIDFDLADSLPEDWREFNKKLIPIWLDKHPGKSKIAAGLSCGALWTVSKGIKVGDIVLSPDGSGRYLVGEILSEYYFKQGEILPHRRDVRWHTDLVERSAMSTSLQNSTGSIGTVSEITKYESELGALITSENIPTLISTDADVEDPSVFALEKHLEEFLVKNWNKTELGKEYAIFKDGDLVGQQFPTDTGPIDILAISKGKKSLLVVELKKGRASDVVVGQIQRYMGYIQDEMAEPGQQVKGVIIALDDDIRLKRALSVTHNITFYRYQVSFKLFRGSI